LPSSRPRNAFLLSLVGGIFYLLISVAVIYAISIGTDISYSLAPLSDLTDAFAAIGLVSALAILLGAYMMNSDSAQRVKRGSILVLVFALVGLVPVGGGYIIGFILSIVGAVMGLRWKPSESPSVTEAGTQPS
jgi:MFS family permease